MSRKLMRVPMDFDWPFHKVYCRLNKKGELACLKPPKGKGFQLWENCSEGSPIGPVFENLDLLCEWAENHATTFADLKLPRKSGKKCCQLTTSIIEMVCLFLYRSKMSTREELEKAYYKLIDEYTNTYTIESGYVDFKAFRDLCICFGFEKARGVYSADEGTNSYKYGSADELLKELENTRFQKNHN